MGYILTVKRSHVVGVVTLKKIYVSINSSFFHNVRLKEEVFWGQVGHYKSWLQSSVLSLGA